jgi:hypothetical protein
MTGKSSKKRLLGNIQYYWMYHYHNNGNIGPNDASHLAISIIGHVTLLFSEFFG